MTLPVPDDLLARVARFIDGVDTSLASANAIEVALGDLFPDHERLHDTVVMLASYRPGGGEWLVDEIGMRAELSKIRALLG